MREEILIASTDNYKLVEIRTLTERNLFEIQSKTVLPSGRIIWETMASLTDRTEAYNKYKQTISYKRK